MTGTEMGKGEAEPMPEEALLKELDLPSLPKLKKGRSHRISIWIEKGLNYSTNSGNRYFLRSDVEAFLHRVYGISISKFKADLKAAKSGPHVAGIYL